MERKYLSLSFDEIFRALRYAVYYNATSFLHSFDFGVEEKLVAMQSHFSKVNIKNDVKLESIKQFLVEILDLIQKLKVPSSEKECIDEIQELHGRWKGLKANWQTNPTREIERIYSEMTPFQYRTISYMRYVRSNEQHKIMLAHAFEIKSMLKNTHFVFIHGQQPMSWVHNTLFKEIKKLEGVDHCMYHYLRYGMEANWTAFKYVDYGRVLDSTFYKQLISADAYFLHAEYGESTAELVNRKKNVRMYATEEALWEYLSGAVSEKQFKSISSEIRQLEKEVEEASSCGNMYAIAIPIREAKKMFYSSHSFGIPCDEMSPEELRFKLSAFQREKQVRELYRKCHRQDQFRIAAGHLNPNDHRIFLLSATENRKEFKQKIRLIAQKFMQFRRVFMEKKWR